MEAKEGVADGGRLLLVLKNPNEASEYCLDKVAKQRMVTRAL